MGGSHPGPRPRPDRAELARKCVHLAAGLPAFALRFIGPLPALALLAAALAFNLWLLPRLGGRALWRRDELEAGAAPALVTYPAVLLALTALFAARLEVAAAAWGVLAFGDGLASLARGGGRLPWNRAKTWGGSAVCWLGGWAAAAVLVAWTAPGRYATPFLLAATGVAALAAAAVESLRYRVDDNLTAPPAAALVLWALLATEGGWWAVTRPRLWLAGIAVSALLAAAAWAAGAIGPSGAAAGLLLGAWTWVGLGARGLALVALFVAVGTAATRFRSVRKRRQNLAEAAGGRRSARHALANGLVAALAALLAGAAGAPEPFVWAFAGALAAAASDTVSSEIGQALGGRTVLAVGGRAVPPGTDGGVSVAGSLAGVAGAGIVAGSAALLGLLAGAAVAPVAAAGLAGNALDSLLGATVERRGRLDNEAVNFLCTLGGALAAFGLWAI